MKNKEFKPSMTAVYFDYEYLSSEAKNYLITTGFCIQDNEHKVWFGVEAIIEHYLDWEDKEYKRIPEDWWKKLNLDPKLRKQIEEIFKENSNNIVIFCYAGDELE